jgi:hypothetical protein
MRIVDDTEAIGRRYRELFRPSFGAAAAAEA